MGTVKTFTIRRDSHQEITLEKPGKYLVELVGPGAEATITGVWDARGTDDVSVEVVIHHKAPNTLANTTMHGVGRDKATVRFVGRIIIDPECGNSNSFLTERVLLLSDTATAETVPDLEILTDDVKCSHAASVSRIPEEQIFYLQSRGIERSTAEDMIVEGFLAL
ncbi:MAG: SufD family Fe-S cluster assembly protein [Pseudomonadales bacterium]|nr:SufD family Fe-S cluster assembly protein [Pseudomonadales bacterium]